MEKASKKSTTNARYPNLSTILMVEKFLKKNEDIPLMISSIKEKLPKKVMHQTLKVLLNYLFASGKILYGPKGIQWIYKEPEYISKMMKGSLEL